MYQNCVVPELNVHYEVIKDRSTDELYYDNTLMLNYDISLPKLRTQGADIDYIPVNSYYSNLASELRNHAKLELYPMAVDDYKERTENGYPFNPYTLYTAFSATYKRKRLFSTYIDIMEYTGGAHPNTVRSAQTWNLCNGKMLKLSELFVPGCNWRDIIMNQIRVQARLLAEQGLLFEGYEPMLVQYFDAKNYYLTNTGVVIYYPLYTIAPYVSGIITFETSYNKLCRCLREDLFCIKRKHHDRPSHQPFVLGRL